MLIITRYSRESSTACHSVSCLSRAIANGSDIVSLPVRMTADNNLVLSTKSQIGPKKAPITLRKSTLKQLQRSSAISERPVITLESALKSLYGQAVIEIELFEWSTIKPVAELIRSHVKNKSDWSSVLITSENPILLLRFRNACPKALLCLKHRRYPLTFVSWQPILRLSAVAFHRLHINTVATEAARKLDLLTYVYTVNRSKSLVTLEKYDIDAVSTTAPDSFLKD